MKIKNMFILGALICSSLAVLASSAPIITTQPKSQITADKNSEEPNLVPQQLLDFHFKRINSGYDTYVPAEILEEPENIGVPSNLIGMKVTLTAKAVGSAPLTYQWFKDDVPIEGATSMSLDVVVTDEVIDVPYYMEVTNDTATSRSNPAFISWCDPISIGSNLVLDYQFTEGPGHDTTVSSVGNVSAALGTLEWSSDSPSGREDEYSLYFNGSNQATMPINYLQFNRNDPSFTIEAWVKSGPQSYRQVLFSNDGPGARFALVIDDGYRVFASLYGVADISTSAEIPQDGKWHHIGFCHDYTDWKLLFYVDGALADYGDYSGEMSFGGDRLNAYIGAEVDRDHNIICNHYKGNLARLRVHTGVLDPRKLDYFNIDRKIAPKIVSVNIPEVVVVGEKTTLSVRATGTEPLSYQWYKDDILISGATDSSYTIDSVQKSDEGSYTVTVSNSAGSVTSSTVALTVDPIPAAKATISMKSVSSAFVTYGDSCGENAGEKVGSEIIGSLLYNGKEIARQTFALSSKGLPTGKLNGDVIETDLVPAGTNVTLQLAAFDQGYLDHPDTGEYYYGISEPFTYHTGDSNDISPDKYLEYSSFTIEWTGDPNKPTIIEQPVSQTVNEGDSVTFSVLAEGGAAGNADFSTPLSSNVNLDMVWIEPGTFLMGSPKDELGRSGDETLHQVTLTKGYWIGKYEVTQAQYKAISGNEPSYFKGADLPVEQVSWNEAMDFCAKLTAIEKAAGRLPAGYEYTLPTEAQWEYACRAGTTTALNSGKNLTNTGECPEMDEVGWYSGNGNATTHPVGQKKPNNWGLYDMHGNVHEWCLDGRGDYPSTAVTDPVAPSTGKRVGRGSGWMNGAAACRSAYRFSNDENYNSYNDGFRVALVLVDASAAQPVVGDSLKYQWFKDGKAIEGATDASYTISNAKKSDEGSYYVVVSNKAGSVTSDVATLTVKQSVPDGTAVRSVKVDGQTATVTLKLLPNDAVNVYFVEETVPAVGTITPNNGGVYTASKNVIRWSFLDGIAREISYTVTVPSDFNKEVTVSGEVTFDTTVRAIEGETVLDFTPKTHPADTNKDYEISTPEISLYAVAWKLGQDWSREPVDIPMNYVARGALIWINGGDYIYDSSKAKPACWVNTVKAASVEMASASTNERKISVADGKANVAIEIIPAEGISVYLVEEQLPSDVTLNVSNISDGGNYIAAKNVIRWSFLDGEVRTLTYTLEPEPGFEGALTLSGEVMFDEETFTTEGDTEAIFGPAINFVVEDDGETLILDFEGILYESDDAINWRVIEGAKAPFKVDTSKGKKFYRSVK
ncbi:MAG: SUMF1/EgtB/PvdO family nonheme iron enzyme [Verrucomicrobia bacterium]|nr:SUMF1/EgtB/PvdO family nonheme iron enzyme [Verrucomicrobiota bacterium]